jgi:hypothetical protein
VLGAVPVARVAGAYSESVSGERSGAQLELSHHADHSKHAGDARSHESQHAERSERYQPPPVLVEPSTRALDTRRFALTRI